jgi:hypothetical protein
MTQIEAMKLALEALVMYGERHRATYLLGGAWDEEITLGDKAITALEEALAQTEQEPVAIKRMKEWIEYLKYLKRTSDQHMKIPSEMSAGTCWELALELEQFINTTPPQRTWVGLTDEDMYVVSEEESCSFIAGAKWSEEILKEKNAICSPFMISELWRLNK